MCGITSIFRNELNNPDLDLDKLAQQMLWVGSIRGYDSTGMFYGDGAAEAELYKKALTGWDFQSLPRASDVIRNNEKTKYLVTHNRAATRGVLSHDNAHPFQIGDITGVHNGTLTMYHNLSPVGFNHTVDSAHLYAAINDKGSSAIIPETRGSFNLLWHDHTDNTIHQVRSDARTYTFAKLKDKEILVGASEKKMLKWLVDRNDLEIEISWDPKPYTEYVWSVEDDMVRPQYQLEHEEWKAPPVVVNLHNNKPPTQHGDRVTQPRAERVEFFFNSRVAQSHVLNGKVHYNYYGQTVEGTEVICYSVPEGKYEFDIWYVADAWITTALSTKKDYYRVQESTIVDHPIEDPDGTFHQCINCKEEYMEDNIVFMDANPTCVPCAHQLAVKVEEIDPGHEWKMYKQ